MSDQLGFTAAERALFAALDDLGIRFLLVGLSAALLQGAPIVTQDVDVWFGDRPDWDRIAIAAGRAGGFYTSGVGMHRPLLGGPGLERLDLVLTAQGLASFDEEHKGAETYDVDGTRVRVLPLARIIASKRAANRAKDRAVLPALEDTLAARLKRGSA